MMRRSKTATSIANCKFAFCIVPFYTCILPGCWSATGPEVVVYSALDREFAEPILNEYSDTTGVIVRGVYDIESSKTVGLVERIIQEADRGVCDLFWNNEILHTLRLEKLGLLRVYRSPSAEAYPAMYRSPDGRWHGFAARARVLIVNTKRVAEADRPRSIDDLANPKWRTQVGIARPLFGTTATHAACLFAALGDEKAREYFRRLKANGVQVLAGNKQVAQRVSAGQLAFGLTDTDDAMIELEAGHPVAIVYPDQADGQLGTLFIPNTLALINGAPNAEQAMPLIDFLLSAQVESKLAAGPSAQIPLNSNIDSKLRTESPRSIRSMKADFARAAEKWESASGFLRAEF
jgi:iron(III) transport system substrate-binding protein